MSWKDNVSKMSKMKNWDGKLYKVLVGNRSCHGGNFEWSLPEGDKPGDWTPTIKDVEMCEIGYHLTTHYAHWSDKDVSIYEAEGDVVAFDGFDKVVCTRARLLRLVKNPFNKDNYGRDNSGSENAGSYNSGNMNSGNVNSGDNNSGNRNSGNHNSGYNNFGTHNSGDCNFGHSNSGDYNSGDRNCGSWNSGNMNCGNWNSSYNNPNFFCRNSLPTMLFDKPVPKDWELEFPGWIYFPLLPEGYHASWQKAFEDASIEGIKELLVLPNFDYEIFEEISSITKEQIEEKICLDV